MATIKARGVAAPRRIRNSSAAAGFWMRLGMLVQIIALLGGIFVLFSYRVSLGEKLTATARETAAVKRQIHELDREIEALRLKKETFSDWPYVKAQIERYQLGLRQAEPDQRRQLMVRRSAGYAVGARRIETAQR